MWSIEFTDEFGAWWNTLDESEQDAVDRVVLILEQTGPSLARPYADRVEGSKHTHMKELRVQHRGEPYRILFAFDPRRTAILLIGGNKAGDKRWYETMIPVADRLYDRHLRELKEEGLL